MDRAATVPVEGSTLPQAREALAEIPRDPKPKAMAVAPAYVPGEEAAAEALAQLDYGEAPHVGIIGDTGTGKTTATAYLIDLYLQKSPGSVLVVDDKEVRPKFKGQYRRDLAELRAKPIDWQQGRVIVFRGDPLRGVRVDLEEVAELAWARAAIERPTLCVFDELIAGREELVKNTQWRKGVTWVPRNFSMGRSPGVADIWGAQDPVEVPTVVFNQSSAILTFRLAGTGLAKLRERNYLVGDVEDVISGLPGPPLPPAERGPFVLLRRGLPWNGKIYKFQRPR